MLLQPEGRNKRSPKPIRAGFGEVRIERQPLPVYSRSLAGPGPGVSQWRTIPPAVMVRRGEEGGEEGVCAPLSAAGGLSPGAPLFRTRSQRLLEGTAGPLL
ncbi:hypothetical protein AAFF_G00205830 [Aldrovandia affinis]|uniref:Uncharacterized protein n=1 Tax=Aldrovandia affinis TaxID=143900 RepID=A0AAD7W5N1_9TELE|nr:hypothetical protein AAFF_G00205830 [Aldrovandia affinis]